ncbi:MAG TPA: dephospho-CoA kinase [Methylibium sp.]|uniref:dephospho-CoA kinase n=1 Tax=Methylibium sp. TaxID=2067992 RepID=UPI002DBCE11C|nr:dephospho-CoA kinase [Methylibium sp.]HEU4458369.1 dephospho-CoA kinase [Methylibium sp.]
MAVRPLRIGLTGGIGSGKSVAAARLVALGAALVDTDAIARALTLPGGAAINALRSAFGDVAIAPDGALDRSWMRERAFADAGVLRRLEAILHPLINIEAQAQAAACTAGVVVFDVPLLVGPAGDVSGAWRQRVHRILVIDCPHEMQIERVLRRPGWTREAVERVIAQQATREQRRAVADAVVDNAHDDLDALHARIDAIWARWTSAAPD